MIVASAVLTVSVPLNSATSYANFKSAGLTPQTLPGGVNGQAARTYADFSGNGRLDLFAAILTYSPSNPIGSATPSRFEFHRKQADGSFVKDNILLASGDGCIHPRKAIVADFNDDDRPDVFVACHGYDALPFPGERNRVVLSQPGGGYVIRDASADVAFFHAAAAADLDGDGDIDVVTINHPTSPVILLINDGTGNFIRSTSFELPPSLANRASYFTVELVDLDLDLDVDLLLGGHEFDSAGTVMLINPGTNDFSDVAPTALPPVANDGVALDFVVTGPYTARILWVLRTSGGDGTFYQSRVIQRIQLATLTSSVQLNERPAQWIPWLIPSLAAGVPVIASDDASFAVSVPQ